MSLLDPLNDAALMVPGVGEEAALAQLGRFGVSGIAARVGAKAAAGATAVTAATVPMLGAQAALGSLEGEDFSLRDAFKSLAINAAVGAVLHAGFGTLADAYKERKPTVEPESTPEAQAASLATLPADAKINAMRAATSQVVDGRPVDVEPITSTREADAERRCREAKPIFIATAMRLECRRLSSMRSTRLCTSRKHPRQRQRKQRPRYR